MGKGNFDCFRSMAGKKKKPNILGFVLVCCILFILQAILGILATCLSSVISFRHLYTSLSLLLNGPTCSIP